MRYAIHVTLNICIHSYTVHINVHTSFINVKNNIINLLLLYDNNLFTDNGDYSLVYGDWTPPSFNRYIVHVHVFLMKYYY